MGSREVTSNRYVVEDESSDWDCPNVKIFQKNIHNLMAIILEITVKTFF